MEYKIDYGFTTETVTGTLDEAKAIADDGAAYTQQPIIITDDSGAEVARRPWWGVRYDADATEEAPSEVIQFGDFGYFGAWQ